MKVVFAKAAKDDLRQIGWWIGADSQINAERFVQRLVAKARSLDQLALRYPLTGLGDIRKMPHKDYLIFYRVTNGVEILRIIHGARDWPSLLDDLG